VCRWQADPSKEPWPQKVTTKLRKIPQAPRAWLT
jgi:hypothetical protein